MDRETMNGIVEAMRTMRADMLSAPADNVMAALEVVARFLAASPPRNHLEKVFSTVMAIGLGTIVEEMSKREPATMPVEPRAGWVHPSRNRMNDILRDHELN